MKTIWKFQIPVADDQTIEIPRGAIALSAHMQDNQICLWALVDDGAEKHSVPVHIRGTGHNCDGVPPRYFVGTVFPRPGLVFHVFVGIAGPKS